MRTTTKSDSYSLTSLLLYSSHCVLLIRKKVTFAKVAEHAHPDSELAIVTGRWVVNVGYIYTQ